MIVQLSKRELACADAVARIVQDEVKDTGAQNRLRGRETTLEERAQGTAGEFAAARCYNKYPTSITEAKAVADVGTGLQVRSTIHPRGHLIVHKEDPLDQHFCLVVALGGGRFDVKGMISGSQVSEVGTWKIDDYGHGGWWVPQSKLSPPPESPLV